MLCDEDRRSILWFYYSIFVNGDINPFRAEPICWPAALKRRKMLSTDENLAGWRENLLTLHEKGFLNGVVSSIQLQTRLIKLLVNMLSAESQRTLDLWL